MNKEQNNGGTTAKVYTTPQTVTGPDGKQHEVRQAVPEGVKQKPSKSEQSQRQQRTSPPQPTPPHHD